MADDRPSRNPLARSQRAAAAAAVIALIFGAVLLSWGASLDSLAMTAGGLFTLGRAVMGALIWIGIRLSLLHSRGFPDGLYKLDNIVATVIGVVILILTYEVATRSISQLGGEYSFTSDPKYALPFFVFAAALATLMGFYKRRVASLEGCPSLRADADFSFADSVALVIIGVALAFDVAGFHRADAVAGLVVGCLLALVGARVFISGMKVLLDASVDRTTLTQLREIALQTPGIKRVLLVGGRNSGSFVFLHLSVEPAAYDVRHAGDIAQDLERRVKSALPRVDSVSIELGAPGDVVTAAVPVGPDGSTVDPGFASTPKIAFLEAVKEVPADDVGVVDNPTSAEVPGRSVHLAVFLGRRAIDVLLVKGDILDEDTRDTLRAYGVSVVSRPSLSSVETARSEFEQILRGPATDRLRSVTGQMTAPGTTP